MTAPRSPQKPASLWRTLKAVMWSFVGLRKSSDYQEDIAKLSLFHVVFVGIAACFVLVIALMLFVHWVVAA